RAGACSDALQLGSERKGAPAVVDATRSARLLCGANLVVTRWVDGTLGITHGAFVAANFEVQLQTPLRSAAKYASQTELLRVFLGSKEDVVTLAHGGDRSAYTHARIVDKFPNSIVSLRQGSPLAGPGRSKGTHLFQQQVKLRLRWVARDLSRTCALRQSEI